MLYLKKFGSKRCLRSICLSCVQQQHKFEDIPGPRALPSIGNLHRYLPLIGEYKFDRLHINGLKKLKKYGPVVKEEIVPGVNIIWLFKPEDMRTMFRSEGKYPQRRSHLALEKYRRDRPSIYNSGGLLPTNGLDWFRLRSVFQKGLSSPASVQNFIISTDKVIQQWLDRINITKQTYVDYLPELSRLFLELTCLAALDLRLNSFHKEELHPSSRSSRLIEAALVTNSCILKTDNGPQLWKRFETPLYRKFRKAQEFMEYVATDLLSLKMSLYDENPFRKQASLLDSYLQSSELDFKDIIGMVCDFLLAGIDTTTYTTSFLFYHLATNPSAQHKLHEESRALLSTPNCPVTKDILNAAYYAKAVLKETFRLRPISVGIGRVLQKDAVFSDYYVPEGVVVVTQNQVSCRLEEYFNAPHEFRPERWLKNDSQYKQPHPYLLLPFGHGPRSCIARRFAEQNMLILLLKETSICTAVITKT